MCFKTKLAKLNSRCANPSLWLGVLLLGAAALAGCSNKPVESAAPGPPPAPVRVGTAVEKDVPVQLEMIGRVEAISSVSIKSQINGQVTQVHFAEGQEVKQGELLFSLDRRSLEAALAQAEATLLRDAAAAEKARADAARYEKLYQEGIVAKEQRDSFVSTAAWYDAVLRADRAAIDSAKVQLSYTLMYAPMSGRTGSLLVHAGDVVKANDNPVMVVINQVQPIYVTFAVPEQSLADVKRYHRQSPLSVAAVIPNEGGGPVRGTLSFIDNAVDASTGTIKLKGTFSNEDRRLWPGQFVNVTLTLTQRTGAVVVPSQAVQTGQNGKYIFVLRNDGTVESRIVETGPLVAGELVIEKGVQAGEQVVTDGQLRLVNGAKVTITK